MYDPRPVALLRETWAPAEPNVTQPNARELAELLPLLTVAADQLYRAHLDPHIPQITGTCPVDGCWAVAIDGWCLAHTPSMSVDEVAP